MSIVPYCVVDELATASAPPNGVAGAPVMEINEGGLRCFYSELDAVPQQQAAIREMALQFQQVVQHVFAGAATIPFRFVTLLRGEEELRDFLDENSERFVKALERLEGCAQFEMHLRRKNGSEAAEAASGTEYLKTKKAAVDVFKATSESLRRAAGSLALGWHLREGDDDARCYALVERGTEAEFKRKLSGAKLSGELRVVMSGPWPPSEFVE